MNAAQNGTAELDLSSVPVGGLYDISINVSDGIDMTGVSLTSWLIADKRVVTISQNVDPEIDDGEKESKDYNIYYLSGNEESSGRTKYLFVGDSLSGQSALENFRLALAASVNKLNDSDASEFFSDDYFTIVAAEPVDPDGRAGDRLLAALRGEEHRPRSLRRADLRHPRSCRVRIAGDQALSGEVLHAQRRLGRRGSPQAAGLRP